MDSDLQERVVAALVLAVGELEVLQDGEVGLVAAGEERRKWSALLVTETGGLLGPPDKDWDGQGHPDHLERVQVTEQIPLGIAVDVDALDAVVDEVRRHRIAAGLPAVDYYRGAAELGIG